MTRLILICFGAASLMASTAIADEVPQAEALYNEGQAAFDHADYAAAIVKWQASFKLSGASGLLFNLAQAYRLDGDCKQALANYRQFVAIDPKSQKRPIATDFIRELEPSCGVPVQTPSVDRPIAEPRRTMKLAGLVTGGAGVILFFTGVGFGHHAATLGDQVTAACASGCDWQTVRDKDAAGRRDAVIGYALDAVGIAAIAGGAIMYYLGDREHAVAISPRPREGGAVVSWSGSW